MKKSPSWHYETAIAEVETLISRIESGDLELAEVVAQFEQAAHTLKRCEAFLQEKRSQVDLVIEQLGEGQTLESPEEEEIVF